MAIDKSNVVSVEHEFGAPVARVFQALKEGRLFFNCGSWPDQCEIDFRKGGKYTLGFGQYGASTGEFLEIIENKRVVFTWNTDTDWAGAVRSQVTIDLSPKGDGCLLKLRHEGFATHEIAEAHEGGWTEGMNGLSDEITKRIVRLEREFKAPVEMLYEACSGMRFFSLLGATADNAKIDFKVGGRYSVALSNGNKIQGEFLEIEKNKKIVYTWESAPCGVALAKPTRVSMEFGPWGDDMKNSYLALVHTGFVDDEAVKAHHEGWNTVVWEVMSQLSK